MYNPQLKTFITVADAGSFNKAAELLFVSSTAIIKQMNLLEDHMEVRLFHRSYRGLSLTESGKRLYAGAKELMALSDQIVKDIRHIERGSSEVVRIGTSPLTPIDYLSALVPQLQAEDVQFQLVPFENNPENARQILDNLGKDIDLVMGIYDERTDAYYQKVQRLTVESLPFQIMMASTHPLAKKERLTWDDLDGHRLYVLDAKWSQTFHQLRQEIIEEHPGIEVVEFPFLETSVFNQFIQNNDLFVGVKTWQKVHPFIATRPMEWDYAIDYGIVYGQDPSDAVHRLIAIVKEHLAKDTKKN